ncbi:hypothetical protein [Methylomonas sp. YC3]
MATAPSLEQRNLADLLEGLGFSLLDDTKFPAFTSADFDSCDNAEDVIEKARHLRDSFTGPAQIDPEFRLGAVIDNTAVPPLRSYFLEVESLTQKISLGDIALSVSPPARLSADELVRWQTEQTERQYQNKLESQRAKLEPAFLNSKAAKVLELLSIENPTGDTIWKIYELAEGYSGNRGDFHTRFDITSGQFNRFKDAIHNPTVSGGWARHARGSNLNSNNPMTKDEAIEFVRQIATSWLEGIRASRNF